jgi:hypothetical protein
LIVSVTFTVTGAPTEGVMTTVALYVPAVKPATFTLKVSGEACPGALLPDAGVTVSQACVGALTVHFNVFPPEF